MLGLHKVLNKIFHDRYNYNMPVYDSIMNMTWILSMPGF